MARAVARGRDFLWRQQAADGGWHSEEYGVLRPGHSLTGHVLAALPHPDGAAGARRAERLARARAFLAARIDEAGGLGIRDAAGAELPVPEYPCYATGLALAAAAAAARDGVGDGARDGGAAELGSPVLRRRLADWLKGRQLGPDLGWGPGDPAFGGFGMGLRARRPAAGPGHVDLSMTRVVLEGLTAAAAVEEAPAAEGLAGVRSAALVFLARLQNADGGFYFSPVEPGINKGGDGQRGFPSYGTATADGILSLLALGVAAEDPRVLRARQWLIAHHRIDAVPGIPAAGPARWAQGLRFYYLAVSARALARLGVVEAPAGRDWRGPMRQALIEAQREDGSWVNEVGSVKEDDPILATSLALQAFGELWPEPVGLESPAKDKRSTR